MSLYLTTHGKSIAPRFTLIYTIMETPNLSCNSNTMVVFLSCPEKYPGKCERTDCVYVIQTKIRKVKTQYIYKQPTTIFGMKGTPHLHAHPVISGKVFRKTAKANSVDAVVLKSREFFLFVVFWEERSQSFWPIICMFD